MLVAGGEFGTTVSLDFKFGAHEAAGTDPSAVNYNPAATLTTGLAFCSPAAPRPRRATTTRRTVDGSCEFPVQYYSRDAACISDDDGDGVCNQLKWQGAKTARPAITTRQPQILARAFIPTKGTIATARHFVWKTSILTGPSRGDADGAFRIWVSIRVHGRRDRRRPGGCGRHLVVLAVFGDLSISFLAHRVGPGRFGLAFRHVDESCWHGGPLGPGLCVFGTEALSLAHCRRGVCPALA